MMSEDNKNQNGGPSESDTNRGSANKVVGGVVGNERNGDESELRQSESERRDRNGTLVAGAAAYSDD